VFERAEDALSSVTEIVSVSEEAVKGGRYWQSAIDGKSRVNKRRKFNLIVFSSIKKREEGL